MIYIDECNLYFTSFCGGVIRQIFDSLNLVVSLAGGSTEVRDLGADSNNRTILVIVSPWDGSSQARVPTWEALHKEICYFNKTYTLMPATSSDAQGWCMLKQYPSSTISISSRSCTRMWGLMLPASLDEASCKELPTASWNWGKQKLARGPAFWVPVKSLLHIFKTISKWFILIPSSQLQ